MSEGPADAYTVSIEGKYKTHGRDIEQCELCPDKCRTCTLARRRIASGATQTWLQCATCKRGVRAVGVAAVAEAVAAGCAVGEWDDSYRDSDETRNSFYADRQQIKRDDWYRRYIAHLRSDRWRALRARVLKRDGGVCRGCLDAPAVHVHHTTYDHMGDELCFELVSLCEDCHEKIHPHMLARHQEQIW